MSSARDDILGRIRGKLGADKRKASEQAVAARLKRTGPQPGQNPIPARGQVGAPARLALFREMAEAVDATVTVVDSLKDVPTSVTGYLAENNLPAEAVMSPDSRMDEIPWADQPLLTLRRGRAEDEDAVGITPVNAAIAETGTLMMTSGAETPVTLNFMPDTHIAIVRASQIVGTYEETWGELRGRTPRDGDGNFMPRNVNWVTGPSRSADIAKTLFLGAHGPRRLHIVVVDDNDEKT
jgi:L-lactate dehydrogenase complex protein LldG